MELNSTVSTVAITVMKVEFQKYSMKLKRSNTPV